MCDVQLEKIISKLEELIFFCVILFDRQNSNVSLHFEAGLTWTQFEWNATYERSASAGPSIRPYDEAIWSRHDFFSFMSIFSFERLFVHLPVSLTNSPPSTQLRTVKGQLFINRVLYKNIYIPGCTAPRLWLEQSNFEWSNLKGYFYFFLPRHK